MLYVFDYFRANLQSFVLLRQELGSDIDANLSEYDLQDDEKYQDKQSNEGKVADQLV